MKEFIEEYGGIMVTCIIAVVLIGCLASLVTPGTDKSSLHDLAASFFKALGATPQ